MSGSKPRHLGATVVRILLRLAVIAAVIGLGVVGTWAHAGVPVAMEADRVAIHKSFQPRSTPFGAFGGGHCRSNRTPVVFIHGNGDIAGNWNAPSSNGGLGVLEMFRRAGYTDCDLFGITYLSPYERELGGDNFHEPQKGELISQFIADVLAYTKAHKVDIVGHSFGVTMTMYALDQAKLWNTVRRFVAIAGGMRGLPGCALVGFANMLSRSCASPSPIDQRYFGFWPDGLAGVSNPKIGEGAASYTRYPDQLPAVRFYTIRAGLNDQFICQGLVDREGCQATSVFADAANVFSQLDVGSGDQAPTGFELNWSFDFFSTGGDRNGVGHLRAKTDTGLVLLRMLASDCEGVRCCVGYRGKCRAD